jgi:hypothetical protein
VHDKPRVSRLRARFRFNRAKTNELLFRYRQTSSPTCPFCPNTTESRSHLLMECPEYHSQREVLRQKLLSLQYQLTINIILGDLRLIQLPVRFLLDILEWTGDFIEYVVETRHMT